MNGLALSSSSTDDRSIRVTTAVRNDKLHRHVVSGIPERPRCREDLDRMKEENDNYAARTNVIIKWNRNEGKSSRKLRRVRIERRELTGVATSTRRSARTERKHRYVEASRIEESEV